MKNYIKNFVLVSFISSSLFASSNFENEADSFKLYNTDLEKTILEEMVASIVHEENIFNLFNEYVLKTGNTTIEDKDDPTKLSFMSWYKIVNNSNNNFVKAYNHDGLIDITFDDKTNVLTISRTLKKENSFATKRYIDELKSRNIKHSFDANGYSSVPYKLPLKTIMFLMKYKEIKADGLYLTNQKELKAYAAPLPLNSSIYVPDGKGDFLLYLKDKDTDGSIKIFYKGLVQTFNGVIIDGNKKDPNGTLLNDDEINAELNKKLPRLKGSIGYVSTSIKIDEGTYKDEKSSIVEYIYNDALLDEDGNKLPGRWVKKFSSVNRESAISANLVDKGVNFLAMSSANDMFIPDRYHEINNGNEENSNFNLFGSAFVGGLYNNSNIYGIKSLSTSEITGLYNRLELSSLIDTSKYDVEDDAYYMGKAVNDYFDDQYKIVFFKPYKTLKYDFKDIFAKSYIYSNVNMKNIAGSLEHLKIKAINYGLDTSFKPDVSSCAHLGEDWSYQASNDKCVKTTYECKGWNTSMRTVNGLKYCYHNNGESEICERSNNVFSTLHGFSMNKDVDSDACVNQVNNIGNNEPFPIIEKFGKKWRIDNTNVKCEDHYQKDGFFLIKPSESYKGLAGCYWDRDDKKQETREPYCSDNEIRVDGVCKSLLNESVSIKKAECKESKLQNDFFIELIENHMFKNKLDKNKYVFDSINTKYNEISIKDSDDKKTYKVCESIMFEINAYNKYYIYPNFDIAFLNIENQGKTEVVKSPNVQYIYRESNISECNNIGENCSQIFDKTEYIKAMQTGKNLTFKHGNLFKENEIANYKVFPKTKRFQIRSEDYKNNQALPYTSYNNIDSNIENILSNNSLLNINLNSINLNVFSNNSIRMKLNSGLIDINSDK